MQQDNADIDCPLQYAAIKLENMTSASRQFVMEEQLCMEYENSYTYTFFFYPQQIK